jgi:hypothetical protein
MTGPGSVSLSGDGKIRLKRGHPEAQYRSVPERRTGWRKRFFRFSYQFYPRPYIFLVTFSEKYPLLYTVTINKRSVL